MLKKVAALVAVLSLLLAASQLALAQQNTDQTRGVEATFQANGGTQTTGVDQTTASDPQQAASQDQPTGDAQAPQPDQNRFVSLNNNNELVVDCQALSDGLASFQQAGDQQTADPQVQSQLALAESLLQLCEANGFTPSGSGGTAPVGQENTAGSAQPQQGGGTPPSPTDTSSAQPHQNEESRIVG